MPILPLLSLTLAIACLSGVNLYLTVFLTGLTVQSGWLGDPVYAGLAIAGHPAVMTVAFLLFAVEAVVDRIPWLDSLWDSLHTVVRPAGAALLAWQALDPVGPGWQSAAAVAAGAAALATHLTKSGLRLLINASPEPFTNIVASTLEDVMVIGLLLLSIAMPVTGLTVCLALLAAVWIALPRMFRVVRAGAFLMWRKLRAPVDGARESGGPLPAALSAADEMHAAPELADGGISWAVPCISGKVRGIPGAVANRFGTLVSPASAPGALLFLTDRLFRRRVVRIPLTATAIRREGRFLSEDLVLYSRREQRLAVFRFPRHERRLVEALVRDLLERTGTVAPSPVADTISSPAAPAPANGSLPPPVPPPPLPAALRSAPPPAPPSPRLPAPFPDPSDS